MPAAPGAPGAAKEKHGVLDDRWQRAVADAAFTWPAADDGGGAGVSHYLLYWGPSPSGSGTLSVTLPAYTPPPVPAPGISYLRAAAVDAAGNAGPWTRLFTFRYDNASPTNPTRATEDHGVPSNTWQRAVSAPSFHWSGATDAHSGVEGDLVYWGV